MAKMKLGEVAQIKKKDWQAKNDPAGTYEVVIYRKQAEYKFSQRRDENNWYIMKVKNPICYKDKQGHWRTRNDWKDPKTKFKIIKVK